MSNSVVALIGSLLVGYEMVNFPIIAMNFVLASAFSISLSLAIGRIFKNPEIAGTTAALISMLTLFLSMVAYDE